MSESIISQETEVVSSNSIKHADAKEISNQVKPAKPSLREEISRGWEWVTFVWKLLPRIGGLGAWIRTFSFIVFLFISRLLDQWGITKKN